MKSLRKNSVFAGVLWSFGSRMMTQVVSFVVSVILARILIPEEYGTVSLILVFTNIANVLVTNGFGEALILQKNVTDTDRDTIFYCSLSFSVLLYLVLYISAPWIASFYGLPEIVRMIRILALQLPFAAAVTIQTAIVSMHMEFQKIFLSTLIGTIISGVIGVICAYTGHGVWALIYQYLSNTCINMIVLLVVVYWKPRFRFSWTAAKFLMKNAWRLTSAALLNAVYSELRSLIIGKRYSTSDLAYYNKGNQFPTLIIANIDQSVSSVVFPVLANKDDKELVHFGRRSMRLTTYIIFPLIIGLFVVAEPMIRFILTEKWIEAVPFLRFSCLVFLCQPVQTGSWQMIKAVGNSAVCLKLEIVKKVIGVFLILASMKYGVVAIAASSALFAFISVVINMIAGMKYTGYSVRNQILDFLPPLLLSVGMGLIVYPVQFVPCITDFAILAIQISLGICVYVLGSVLFRLEGFYVLFEFIKTKIMKRG